VKRTKIRMLLSLELCAGCGRLSKYFDRICSPACRAHTVEKNRRFGADYDLDIQEMAQKIASHQLPQNLDRSFDIVWCCVPKITSRCKAERFMISLVRIFLFYHAKNVNTLFCIESQLGQMKKCTDFRYLEAHLRLSRVKISMCSFSGMDGGTKAPCGVTNIWSNSEKLLQKFKKDCRCRCVAKTIGESIVYPKEFCFITAQMLVAEAALFTRSPRVVEDIA
jgi:hypothetical protein